MSICNWNFADARKISIKYNPDLKCCLLFYDIMYGLVKGFWLIME